MNIKTRKRIVVVLLLLSILAQPISILAVDVSSLSSIDNDLYVSDWLGKGYFAECYETSTSDLKLTIGYVDGDGDSVGTTTIGSTIYVPTGTQIKLRWSMSGESSFASKNLDVWQHSKDSDYKTVTSYNIGNADPIGLRGKSSKLVGEIVTSKTNKKWEQIYSLDDFNSIKFLCGSLQYDGSEGESKAVGNVMGNVNYFYYLKSKPIIVIDDTPPTVTASLSNEPVNGWYAPKTKATFTASDADSGVASLTVGGAGRSNPFEMELPVGDNDITYSATDNAGRSSGDKKLSAKVDGTAPSLKAEVSSGEVVPGWYKDEVSVILSASDGESGVKSFQVNDVDYASGSATALSEGTNTFRLKATDSLGNAANEATYTYNVDKTAPNISIAGGTSTWTNQDESLTITGQDTLSGMTSMEVQYSTDNANWQSYDNKNYGASQDYKSETVMANKNGFYRLIATDAVGHMAVSSQTIYISKIDKEKPTIVATVTGDEGAPFDKWYRKSAKIKIVATDNGVSGLKQLIYNNIPTANSSVVLPTTTEDVNKFIYSALDNAGNSTGNLQTDIYVDASAPTDLDWTSNQGTWTNQDITVSMQAKDVYSGLQKFVVQKKNETTKAWDDYTETIASFETGLTSRTALIHENGTYRFKAIDRVGYETIVDASKYIVIDKIDKEKPIVTPTEIGTVSANGWYKNAVNLKLFAKDFGVSGLKTLYVKIKTTTAQTDYPDPQTMTGSRTEVVDDEGTTTATYRADDWAGNVSDTGKSILKIDKTAPKNVSVSADTSTWTNTSVKVTANATDIMSGLDSIIVQRYETDKWVDYVTNDFNGESVPQITSFDIGENGIYRIKAVDMVGFEMTSDMSMGGSEITEPKKEEPKPGIIIIDKIDKTKPLIEATLTGAGSYKDTSGGWYKDDVRLDLVATDEASGVGTITCSGDISTNAAKSKTYGVQYPPFQNGVNHFSYFATDVAGNNSETGTTDIKIDMTNPLTAKFTKLTTEWVNSATGVTFECIGQDEDSGLQQFILERSDNGSDGWIDEVTYTYLGETTEETVNMIVKKKGYYRLTVFDRVQNVSYSSNIILVDNIDDTVPLGESLGITPDTEEWVNENTGVDLTATGQDEASGVSIICVLEQNEDKTYHEVFKQKFNGEINLLSTEYLTHFNGYYKTRVEDNVGNKNEMLDIEALEVPNIDPIEPYLVVDVDSTQWASQEKGYEIYAYAKDNESGLNSVELQMKDENGEWQNTYIDFEKKNYVKNEENLSTYEGNFAHNTFNKLVLAVNKHFFRQKAAVSNDMEVSGTNQMVKVLFKVTKNGTYRVVTDDIVSNTTKSGEVTVTTMDFDAPNLMVEGNPTDWTNQTATIKVTAKDATSSITKMLLNGKEVSFHTVNNASFFSFDAENNETFKVEAYDKAGHNVLQDVIVSKIDKENPYTDSEMGEWVEGVAEAKVTVGDTLSGIRSAYVNDVMIEVPDGHQTTASAKINAEVSYMVTITDNAGNMVKTQISDNKMLDCIKVTTPPEKTKYKEKENFEQKGMVVTAYYTDGSSREIANYIITNGNNLALNQDKLNVTYMERGITKEDNTSISVIEEPSIEKVLDRIKVTTPPEKTKYKVKENFEQKGMVVTAYYTDGSSAVITDYEIIDGHNLEVKQKKIEITYTEGEITKGDETGISVSVEQKIDEPETPITSVKPADPTPVIPKATPVKPTPTTPEPEAEETVVENEVKITKEVPKKEVVKEIKPEPQIQGKKDITVATVVGGVAGTSMFLIFLFVILTNVKVYTMKEDGGYKFIGRTRAKTKEGFYHVKTNPVMIMSSSSGDFKFVFSKGFVKTHKDINVIVRIEHKTFNRYLAEGENSIYVEFDA